MILIRDVFQIKFGKAKEVKSIWPEMKAVQKKFGYGPARTMFDLTGPYYTFVMESTYDSLAAYEKAMKETMSSPEFAASYQKLTPLVESGHREVYTLLD